MPRYFDNRGVMADNIFGKFGLNGIQWKPQKLKIVKELLFGISLAQRTFKDPNCSSEWAVIAKV